MRFLNGAIGFAILACFSTMTSADSAPKGYELNESPHGHAFRYSVQGEPVRRGRVAERYELRDGDCRGSDCKAGRSRSEIRLKKSATKARLGEDIWYGWSFYNQSIPTFSNDVNLMPVVGQWKMGANAHPVFKLVYNGSSKTINVQLDDMKVAANWGKAERYGHVCQLFALSQSRGRWVDIVVNTNFSNTVQGYLRVWVNGQLKCDYRGQLVANTSKKLYPGPNHRRGIFVSYAQRWDKEQPSKPKPTMVAFFDEFLVGSSRDDVDTRQRETRGLPPVD